MGRLADTFARLRQQQRGGLVTYVTAGDPDAETSEAVLLALAEGGADVIEVGVPFSDPLADGPVIQRATERALAGGMTLRRVLALITRVRALIRRTAGHSASTLSVGDLQIDTRRMTANLEGD